MFTHSILKQKNVDSAEGTGNLIYKENSVQNDPCIKVRADAHLQGHAAITVQTRSAFEDILLQVRLLPWHRPHRHVSTFILDSLTKTSLLLKKDRVACTDSQILKCMRNINLSWQILSCSEFWLTERDN